MVNGADGFPHPAMTDRNNPAMTVEGLVERHLLRSGHITEVNRGGHLLTLTQNVHHPSMGEIGAVSISAVNSSNG